MSFAQRLRDRRQELKIPRDELARALGVTRSAIGNYEIGLSSPKEDILLRLFDVLDVDPNYLYQDSYRKKTPVLSAQERTLMERYRQLAPTGRQAVQALTQSLCTYQEELRKERPAPVLREIPLYRSPAAAGFAAPVFGEDFDYLTVTEEMPRGVEFAVRIQGDSMSPWMEDGSTVYVNRDPLKEGDAGIFCVDGDMLCKQYFRQGTTVYLFSLNRTRSDADVVLTADSGRSLVCFGRVMLHGLPLPGEQ